MFCSCQEKELDQLGSPPLSVFAWMKGSDKEWIDMVEILARAERVAV